MSGVLLAYGSLAIGWLLLALMALVMAATGGRLAPIGRALLALLVPYLVVALYRQWRK